MSEPEPTPPAGPPRITTRDGQGRDVVLVRPRSFAARYGVVRASVDNVENACAAALALCWPWLTRQLKPYNHKPLDYGAAVIDLLTDQGVQMVDIMAHGIEALKLCGEGLADGKEVEARVGFSDRKVEVST
jgi:hypothetical protein